MKNDPGKLKITVMLGGPSAEREVSLRSGAGVVKALRSLGHEVHEVDPSHAKWQLPKGTEVVFLALHGTYGEDGTVQRRLEELRVPYTGCDPEASRIGFDKFLSAVWQPAFRPRASCSLIPRWQAGRWAGTRRSSSNPPGRAPASACNSSSAFPIGAGR
jgi:D-alanine-D-alanine ligase-like ATP-grasp enzyme